MICVVRDHRGLRNVRVRRLLLHAREIRLRLLLHWLYTERGCDDVALVVVGKVVRPVGLLVDGHLLHQNLVTDLPDDVPVGVEHHVLVAAHAAAVVVEVNGTEVALVVASIADLEGADLGAGFSGSCKTELRLIFLMFVLNVVGVRIHARDMCRVLVVHSTY